MARRGSASYKKSFKRFSSRLYEMQINKLFSRSALKNFCKELKIPCIVFTSMFRDITKRAEQWVNDDFVKWFCDTVPKIKNANNIEDLLKILQEESELAVKWFRDNNMIVNPDKFQAIILQKGNKEHENKTLAIENIEISTTKSVELLGLTIDDRLTFEEHISTLCKRASLQLNAISRLQKYMNQKEKEAIINSFIYSNFNYCPLVWHFCSCKSSHKIEQIQKRCLRIILNDNESDYETLLEKSNKETMTVKRMRTIATEIFKTINDLNPKFMKEIFIKKVNPKVRPNNIVVKSHSTATYGDRSLSVLGPKLWNSLPENIKSENSYSKFKEYIKTWFGPTCYCSYCKN